MPKHLALLIEADQQKEHERQQLQLLQNPPTAENNTADEALYDPDEDASVYDALLHD